MTRFIFLFLLVMAFYSNSIGQRRAVISVPQLEELMNSDNDTTYVINFWATWCRPCVAELPYFEQLNKEQVENKVRVVLVSLDFSEAWDEKVKDFLAKRDIKSDVLLLDEVDANIWVDKVSEKWGGAIPVTLVVGNGRKINDFYDHEFHSYDELYQIVKPYIN